MSYEHKEIDVQIRNAIRNAADNGNMKKFASACGLKPHVCWDILNTVDPISMTRRSHLIPMIKETCS